MQKFAFPGPREEDIACTRNDGAAKPFLAYVAFVIRTSIRFYAHDFVNTLPRGQKTKSSNATKINLEI